MAEVIDISPDVFRPLTWNELVNGLQQVGLNVTPSNSSSGGNKIVNIGNADSPIATDIQSSNYRAGSRGWKLYSNGNFEGSNGTFRGSITGATGTFTGSITIGTGNAVFKADGNGIYLGHATFASAPFRVTMDGIVTATSGTIGGWTISSSELSNGNFKLQSTAERILVGSATAPLTGTGVFIGKDGTDYEFRVGNPAGKYIHFDGTTGFTMNGMYISQAVLASIAAGSALEIQNWQFNGVFSATDYNTVAWTAGTLTLADGTTYSIDAGNTGNMAAVTYIYFSYVASTTVLQTSTTAANAVGAGKILICVANNVSSPKDAEYQVFGGTGGISKLITADNIAASTITADEIAGNTITANKLTISTLSAIAADMGTITAGNITLNASGYIKGGQSDYNTGTGFFLGYKTDNYKFSIGDAVNNMTYDPAEGLLISGGTLADFLSDKIIKIGGGRDLTQALNAGGSYASTYFINTLIQSGAEASQVYTDAVVNSTKALTFSAIAKVTFPNTDACAAIALSALTSFSTSGVNTSDNCAVVFKASDGKAYLSTADGTTQSLTELAGVTITNYNYYKIVSTGSSVKCYVNKVLKATHTTNLADATALRLDFFTTAAAANQVDLNFYDNFVLIQAL